MFKLPATKLTSADITALIEGSVRENRYVDYKKQLPDKRNERSKRDFLVDVAAFANAGGGDIIYGIAEQKDDQGKDTGFPGEVVGIKSANFDTVKQTLNHWMEASLDPVVPGVSFDEIRHNDVVLFVVRVSRSWIGPHMVPWRGGREFAGPDFHIRVDGQNQPLDTAGLRAEFLASEATVDRICRFRDDRLASISSGDTPLEIGERPRIVLHAVPLSMKSRHENRISSRSLENVMHMVTPMGSHAIAPQSRFNLDGAVVYRALGDGAYSYVQLFRSGGVEYVEAQTLGAGEEDVVHCGNVEEALIGALQDSLLILANLGIDGTVTIMPSLVGVHNYRLEIPELEKDFVDATGGAVRIQENILSLPETVVASVANQVPDEILHDAIDVMWQAGGKLESPNYKNGRWQKPKKEYI